jgi:hypothetical protein
MRTTKRKNYSRKHRDDPKVEVICVVVLVVILLLTHYMHL